MHSQGREWERREWEEGRYGRILERDEVKETCGEWSKVSMVIMERREG